jgi:signal transduction histidine kinase
MVINDQEGIQYLISANIGSLYRELGIYNLALDYYLEALNYREKINDLDGKGWLLIDIGNIYFDQNEFDIAIDHYQESINIFRSLLASNKNINSTATNHDGIAVNLNNIGLCFRQKNNYKKAIEYHNLAVENRLRSDNYGGVAHAYNYIARLYKENNYQDSAKKYYNEAINLFKKDIFEINKDYSYNAIYLAETYIDYSSLFLNEEINKSISLLDSAKYIIDIFDLKTAYIKYKLNLLEIFNKQNRNDKFDRHLNNLIKYVHDNRLEENLDMIYRTAYNKHKATNNQDSIIKYLELSRSFRDSLINKLLKGSIIGIEQKIDLEKKSNELEKIAEDKALQEIKLAEQNKFILILIISVALLIALVGIYFYLNQFKKKTNKLLIENNEELNRSKEELQKLNTTKDKFFSIIAHDLRNPIGAVKNISEVLVTNYNDFDDKEKREFIEEMAISLSSISKLLENLLTWSRSQRGIIHYNPEDFNLNLLIQNNIKILENWAQDKKVKLINSVDRSLIIIADTEMVNTVLRNLISNGIKYTQENGYVKISAIRMKDHIEISVQDNGIGIPENIKNELFKAKSFSSRLGTNNEQGTGLGLILSKEFVEKHGGIIGVESAEYKGTRFYFTIPIKKPSEKTVPERL